MTLQTLIIRYSAFAIVAIIVNLLVQRLILSLGSSALHLAAALAAGTAAGLVVKYGLDKRWIFHDNSSGLRVQGEKFALYSGLGLITTAILWGLETLFWLVWQTDIMREIGAALGLTLGYVIKYRLDKRFVFTNRRIGATV